MSVRGRVRVFGVALLVAALAVPDLALAQAQAPTPTPAAAVATPAPIATPEFVYRFQPRDTLIAVCRRLLLQPLRWPEVQRRNGIRDPFNIPPDTPVRIPYEWLRLTPETAIVRAVAGTVTRDGVRVGVGDVLAEGARLETGGDGSVSIEFADASVVTMQKSTVLHFERLQGVAGTSDGHRIEIRLESGRADTRVQPKRDVGRFEIVTPVAISAVRGTQFRTGYDAAASNATTETLEGTVGVGSARDTVAVAAGFGTRVESSGAVLAPVPLLPAPELAAAATNGAPRLRVEFPALERAVRYRLQLAADAEFRALLADESATTPAFDLPAPADGAYWLRVRGIDALGLEGRDAVRALTQHALPPAPELRAPADGAGFITDGTTLEWAAGAGVTGYRVQVARDAAFSSVVQEFTAGVEARAALTGLAPGSYFWRIAGLTAAGEAGEWSAPRAFRQHAAAPVAEALRTDRRELALRWPTRDGETYRLQIARDADFRDTVVDTTLATDSYSLPRPRAGAYHVRLQVVVPGVADEPFGAARRFDVSLPLWLKILIGSTAILPGAL